MATYFINFFLREEKVKQSSWKEPKKREPKETNPRSARNSLSFFLPLLVHILKRQAKSIEWNMLSKMDQCLSSDKLMSSSCEILRQFIDRSSFVAAFVVWLAALLFPNIDAWLGLCVTENVNGILFRFKRYYIFLLINYLWLCLSTWELSSQVYLVYKSRSILQLRYCSVTPTMAHQRRSLLSLAVFHAKSNSTRLDEHLWYVYL